MKNLSRIFEDAECKIISKIHNTLNVLDLCFVVTVTDDFRGFSNTKNYPTEVKFKLFLLIRGHAVV
jgi:hypothetical protein